MGIDGLRGHGCARPPVDQASVEANDAAVDRARKTGRALGDRVEHRLDVRRRAEITRRISRGRRLLLERLGQLAVPRLELREQPHVLDGDHRLVGEGLQERDLLRP